MERTNRGLTSAQTDRSRASSGGTARPRRLDRLNPESRVVNRSLRAAEFDQFARSVQRDLNPRGPLERLVTRQAIRSAWRLQTNLDAVAATDEVAASPETERAARSLEVAITTLDLLQGRRIEEPLLVDPSDDSVGFESNEWPVVPGGFEDDLAPELEAEEFDDAPIWRDRLIYDFDVSDHSPIIKGTWITVSHVISLIIDGATWADILRTHPELVEADIRMCVAYAVAEENSVL